MNVALCGREYPLRFTVNALCSLEERTGISLDALQSRQLSCLRGLLWCGLTESQPGLSLQQAGEMIDAHLRDGGDMAALADQLAAALEDACFFHRKAEKESAGPSLSVSDTAV